MRDSLSVLGWVLLGLVACNGKGDEKGGTAGASAATGGAGLAIATGGSGGHAQAGDAATGGAGVDSHMGAGNGAGHAGAKSDAGRGAAGNTTHGDAGAAAGRGASGAGGATGGKGSAGGANSCPPECLRAYTCAASCGAMSFNNGCCPCPSGTIDTITCTSQGYCGTPCMGAKPDDAVVAACNALTDQAACAAWHGTGFPSQCAWHTVGEKPCLAP